MSATGKDKRIGVFICHCGLNIAQSVDVERVAETIRDYPGVAHAQHYQYMCSEPGQELIRKAIREYRLNAVINANCSPSLHEKTFRGLVQSEGLNPFHQEVANIREHCSWPHSRDREGATRKAIAIIRATVDKLRLNMALTPAVINLTRRVLVIGAGVAGMEAALRIANGGYEVALVESSPAVGGRAAQLAGTFPTLERPVCLVAPMMAQVAAHPGITLYAYSEVEEVSGYVGNFAVKIRRKAAHVDAAKCSGCGRCFQVCPVSVPSEFERGLADRKAIYRPFEQAVPRRPVIDAAACAHFTDEGCRACEEACADRAIDYAEQDGIVEEEFGAVVVATGHTLIAKGIAPEYASDPDIVDGLQFERLLSPTGPTGGVVRKPSNGSIPKQVVFIQCVGSRDQEHGVSYCSRVCCLYTAKQTLLYKRSVPDGQAYVFYMDIRSDVKGTEEFVQHVVEQGRTMYLRGRVSRAFRDGDRIRVLGVDTLSGKSVEIEADMVVLATSMVPQAGARDLARTLNIIADQNGFFTEAHLKLRPVDTLTSGVYLAGTAQWPRDIPDTIASASGAASRILSLFSREELLHDPAIAFVDEELCVGCGQCVSLCAYKAITLDGKKKVACVNEAICEGCGACAAACPSKAMKHKNWTPRQFFNVLDVFTKEYC